VLWVFDINETLLDMSPVDAIFERHTGRRGLRPQWFDMLIRTALATTATGGYRDFAQLGAACARVIGRLHGAELDDAAIGQLGATMRALPAHPEVPAALAALRARGHRLVALGNSPAAVIAAQLEHAGLAAVLDAAYSAEAVEALKPAPAAYRFVMEAERVAPTGAVMIAAHDWDIAGAQAVGMRTVYVARGPRPPLPTWPDPDRLASDLAEATATDLPG
jgi:2-haloacid dehalogenase